MSHRISPQSGGEDAQTVRLGRFTNTLDVRHDPEEVAADLRWRRYVRALGEAGEHLPVVTQAQIDVANRLRLGVRAQGRRRGGRAPEPQSTAAEEEGRPFIQLSWDTDHYHLELDVHAEGEVIWFALSLDDDECAEGEWTWAQEKRWPQDVLRWLDRLLEDV